MNQFHTIQLSLRDMLGSAYTERVLEATSIYGVLDQSEAETAANGRVELYPPEHQKLGDDFLPLIGRRVTTAFENDNDGAATIAFQKAFHKYAAPIGGFGCMKTGEDGRLYLIGKSEHYHASLGHNFNGYTLIDNARRLGVMNAAHNNTRGYITRLLERELIRAANGSDCDLNAILASKEAKVLNRVVNLETGSVAAEAGIKMMLARFYRLDASFDRPQYDGKTPVLLVMGDYNGTKEANYHGTSVTTQLLRGMWPDMYALLEKNNILKIVPVSINDADDFRAKIERYNSGDYKTAGFIHEIVLMNYGAVTLTKEYLQRAYSLCEQYDTPVMVDEIQSCMWYPGMFLYRLYDLKPDFVVLGKGFPGGEYPASKLITTYEMDNLNQFGALVTNGQEELASLAYLITMKFSSLNKEAIEENGAYFNGRLRELAQNHRDLITKIEGRGHLAGIHFLNVDKAAEFTKILNDRCIETTVQLYKAHCPPAVLFKPPLIASKAVLDFICEAAEEALLTMKGEKL